MDSSPKILTKILIFDDDSLIAKYEPICYQSRHTNQLSIEKPQDFVTTILPNEDATKRKPTFQLNLRKQRLKQQNNKYLCLKLSSIEPILLKDSQTQEYIAIFYENNKLTPKYTKTVCCCFQRTSPGDKELKTSASTYKTNKKTVRPTRKNRNKKLKLMKTPQSLLNFLNHQLVTKIDETNPITLNAVFEENCSKSFVPYYINDKTDIINFTEILQHYHSDIGDKYELIRREVLRKNLRATNIRAVLTVHAKKVNFLFQVNKKLMRVLKRKNVLHKVVEIEKKLFVPGNTVGLRLKNLKLVSHFSDLSEWYTDAVDFNGNNGNALALRRKASKLETALMPNHSVEHLLGKFEKNIKAFCRSNYKLKTPLDQTINNIYKHLLHLQLSSIDEGNKLYSYYELLRKCEMEQVDYPTLAGLEKQAINSAFQINNELKTMNNVLKSIVSNSSNYCESIERELGEIGYTKHETPNDIQYVIDFKNQDEKMEKSTSVVNVYYKFEQTQTSTSTSTAILQNCKSTIIEIQNKIEATQTDRSMHKLVLADTMKSLPGISLHNLSQGTAHWSRSTLTNPSSKNLILWKNTGPFYENSRISIATSPLASVTNHAVNRQPNVSQCNLINRAVSSMSNPMNVVRPTNVDVTIAGFQKERVLNQIQSTLQLVTEKFAKNSSIINKATALNSARKIRKIQPQIVTPTTIWDDMKKKAAQPFKHVGFLNATIMKSSKVQPRTLLDETRQDVRNNLNKSLDLLKQLSEVTKRIKTKPAPRKIVAVPATPVPMANLKIKNITPHPKYSKEALLPTKNYVAMNKLSVSTNAMRVNCQSKQSMRKIQPVIESKHLIKLQKKKRRPSTSTVSQRSSRSLKQLTPVIRTSCEIPKSRTIVRPVIKVLPTKSNLINLTMQDLVPFQSEYPRRDHLQKIPNASLNKLMNSSKSENLKTQWELLQNNPSKRSIKSITVPSSSEVLQANSSKSITSQISPSEDLMLQPYRLPSKKFVTQEGNQLSFINSVLGDKISSKHILTIKQPSHISVTKKFSSLTFPNNRIPSLDKFQNKPAKTSQRSRSSSPKDRSISPRYYITPKDRSISPREHAISPRERSMSPRERSISPRERSISPRERSISPRNHGISYNERLINPRDRPSSRRERPISPRDYTSTSERVMSSRDRYYARQRLYSPKENATSRKESATSRKERPITPKKSATSSKERPITPKTRSTSSKDSPFTPKVCTINSTGKSITPKERPHSAKGHAITSKERPISRREHLNSQKDRPKTPKARSCSPAARSNNLKSYSTISTDKSISSKEKPKSPRGRPRTPKEGAPSPKERPRTPKERSISPRACSYSPKTRSINSNTSKARANIIERPSSANARSITPTRSITSKSRPITPTRSLCSKSRPITPTRSISSKSRPTSPKERSNSQSDSQEYINKLQSIKSMFNTKKSLDAYLMHTQALLSDNNPAKPIRRPLTPTPVKRVPTATPPADVEFNKLHNRLILKSIKPQEEQLILNNKPGHDYVLESKTPLMKLSDNDALDKEANKNKFANNNFPCLNNATDQLMKSIKNTENVLQKILQTTEGVEPSIKCSNTNCTSCVSKNLNNKNDLVDKFGEKPIKTSKKRNCKGANFDFKQYFQDPNAERTSSFTICPMTVVPNELKTDFLQTKTSPRTALEKSVTFLNNNMKVNQQVLKSLTKEQFIPPKPPSLPKFDSVLKTLVKEQKHKKPNVMPLSSKKESHMLPKPPYLPKSVGFGSQSNRIQHSIQKSFSKPDVKLGRKSLQNRNAQTITKQPTLAQNISKNSIPRKTFLNSPKISTPQKSITQNMNRLATMNSKRFISARNAIRNLSSANDTNFNEKYRKKISMSSIKSDNADRTSEDMKKYILLIEQRFLKIFSMPEREKQIAYAELENEIKTMLSILDNEDDKNELRQLKIIESVERMSNSSSSVSKEMKIEAPVRKLKMEEKPKLIEHPESIIVTKKKVGRLSQPTAPSNFLDDLKVILAHKSQLSKTSDIQLKPSVKTSSGQKASPKRVRFATNTEKLKSDAVVTFSDEENTQSFSGNEDSYTDFSYDDDFLTSDIEFAYFIYIKSELNYASVEHLRIVHFEIVIFKRILLKTTETNLIEIMPEKINLISENFKCEPDYSFHSLIRKSDLKILDTCQHFDSFMMKTNYPYNHLLKSFEKGDSSVHDFKNIETNKASPEILEFLDVLTSLSVEMLPIQNLLYFSVIENFTFVTQQRKTFFLIDQFERATNKLLKNIRSDLSRQSLALKRMVNRNYHHYPKLVSVSDEPRRYPSFKQEFFQNYNAATLEDCYIRVTPPLENLPIHLLPFRASGSRQNNFESLSLNFDERRPQLVDSTIIGNRIRELSQRLDNQTISRRRNQQNKLSEYDFHKYMLVILYITVFTLTFLCNTLNFRCE